MTSPLDFLYRNQPAANPAPQQQGGMDWLYDKPSGNPKTPPTASDPGQQQGFFDYAKNVATNWWKTANVSDKMEIEKMTGKPAQYDADETAIRNAILAGQKSGNGMDLTIKDFAHFGTQMFSNVKDQMAQVFGSPRQTVDQIKSDFPGFLGGIAKAFATPISDMMDLSYGVKLEGEDVGVLTAEDKRDRLKNVVATAAMAATGAAVGKALGAGSAALRGAVAAEEAAVGSLALATDAFTNASRLTTKGAFAQQVLKNTAVAATSGTTYGMVRYANEKDQLAQTLINGIVFAPLGVAFEVAGLAKGTREAKELAARAGDVAVLRQAQRVLNNTTTGIVENVAAMSSADDLAEAVMRGKLATTRNDVIHIPGVSSERLSDLANNLPKGFKSAYRFDPSGESGSILVYNEKVSDLIDPKFYAENGFLKEQIVSHNGAEYKVAQGDGKELLLENLQDGSHKITVPIESVRALNDTKLATPALTQFTSQEFTPGENTRYWKKAADEAGEGAAGISQTQSTTETGVVVHKFVMRDEAGKPQGVLEIRQSKRAQAGEVAADAGGYGLDIRVDPAQQRRGIGSQLYKAAHDAGFDIEGISDYQLRTEPGKMFAQGRLMKGARMTVLTQENALDRMYGEWKKQAEEPVPTKLDLLKEQREVMNEQMNAAAPEDKTKWQSEVTKLQAQIDKLERAAADPAGFDEPGSNKLTAQEPQRGVDYQADMRDFFNSKGISPEDHAPLAREFEKRFAKEVLDGMDPDEKKFIQDAHASAKAIQDAEIAARRKKGLLDSEQLIRLADSNGFEISDADGTLSIRDAESKKVMFKTNSLQEAANWIDGTGQAEGVDLDAGGAIKSNSAAGGRTLNGANRPVGDPTYSFFGGAKKLAKNLSSENAIRFLDNFALITQNREYFTGLDSRYNTKFFTNVFDKTQTARRIANARIRPYYEKLQGVEKIVAKMSPADREMIGRYMQTMTPDEVKAKYKANRIMNATEIKTAEGIANSGADIERIFGYRRQLKKIRQEFAAVQPTDVEGIAQRDKAVLAAKEHFGIDDKHQEVVHTFDTIEDMNKNQADLGAIVRLARAIQDNELSRADFASKHKMTFEQMRAANQLDAMYREMAGVFKIPPSQRLGGYMTHARLYADGNVGEALRMFGMDTEAREFYAKMARTGEISAYEMDPIRAMQRYIKGGMDAIHFSEAFADAKNAAVEEIKKLPAGMRDHVQAVTERYLGDLRGFPGAPEAATQAAVDNLLDKFKIDADVSVRRQIVNGITAVVPAATQGIRIMAGVRDFATHMVMYSSRFGYKRTARAITLGGKAMSGPIRAELERLGDITVASPITFADAVEQQGTAIAGARGAIARGLDKTTKVMFKLSGQQDVYAMMHAGAYLETRELAAGALLDLTRGKAKWRDVVKRTMLETYDQPVYDHFKELAEAGKTDEAARFLAVQTGYEQIGVFGLANQPYLWGTNAGRIVGQFGRWPTWLRTNITRMASRGTPAQRIAAMARLAAGTAAIGVAGKELGLNLDSWNPIKGLFFAGGPLVDVYETINDAVGGSGYIQGDAQRRLGKMLPWNQLKQIYLPGSYFADDVVKAIQQYQRGNLGSAAAQLGGFHPTSAGGSL